MKITKTDRVEVKKVLDRFSQPKGKREVFYDLCFALLAPQTKWTSNIKVTGELKRLNFYNNDLSVSFLREVVRPTRFYNVKADRLIKAKKQFDEIFKIINSNEKSTNKRNKLVNMVNGLGMKAASHFLRNLGCRDLAIIDTHILKFLGCDQPKNKKDYIRIEEEFISLSTRMGLDPVELDAIIWKRYSNTEWCNFVY